MECSLLIVLKFQSAVCCHVKWRLSKTILTLVAVAAAAASTASSMSDDTQQTFFLISILIFSSAGIFVTFSSATIFSGKRVYETVPLLNC